MQREIRDKISMEELIGEGEKTPLLILVKETLDNTGSGFNYHDGQLPCQSSSSSSSVTFVVVLSAFVVSCGSYALGNVMGYSSPAESGIVNDLGLTVAEYSFFVSIAIIGLIFGAIWSGKITDVIGRRRAMGVSSLLCNMGWLAIAFSKGPWCLDVGRFLLGWGTALASYAGPVYISEITSKNVRGTFMSLMPLITSCGKALFFLIGSFVNWRTLALIGLVPCLLQLLGLFFIPESPRWLMKISEAQESEKALQLLRGEKADVSQEIADIKNCTEYSRKILEDGILSLFQKKYAHCLIIGLGLLTFRQCGGISGISFYTSTILQSAGLSTRIGSIAVGVVEVLTAVLLLCSIDKFGRRPLLLMSVAGTCLGCALIGLSFLFQDLHFGKHHTPVLALSGLLVYFGSFVLGEGIPWIIALEIFPINIKGAAGSIMLVISSISGWVISYTFNFIFEWNSAGVFFIFAAISGANILFTWKMAPETKGRALEEIQASITRRCLQ